MSIQKKYLKSRPVCKVTFSLPKTMGETTNKAFVVGEFNDWSTSATPMKKRKNGRFSTTVDLETGCAYQFRYLLGETRWENDPEADGDTPTPFGDSRNSVIHLSGCVVVHV